MGGICGLRPAHSYFAGGIQLPIESRMVGSYGGFMVTLTVLVALGRLRARRLGSMPTIMLLVVFFASMVVDGVNSRAAVAYPAIGPPQHRSRRLSRRVLDRFFNSRYLRL